jgi:hypothetical protein
MKNKRVCTGNVAKNRLEENMKIMGGLRGDERTAGNK